MVSHDAARQPFDVAVIGGGVVGCAVARLLSHHDLRVALIESRNDVGAATSKANTAILHTGFDATPGSVESRLVARGYELLSQYAPVAGVSIEQTGALLVAWTDEQVEALPRLRDKAVANGYDRCEVVTGSAVYDAEPHLGPGALGGMTVPDEHIVDPWSTPLAFARDAIANGCELFLNTAISAVQIGESATTLSTDDDRTIVTGYVVNAAGLFGDHLHQRFGFDGLTIRPRRGELLVYDKFARPLLNGTVLPVPTAHTKGVLVAPTVFGNVMVGPTADDIDDRAATASTADGIARLRTAANRLLPGLANEDVTAVYAGLRAATEHSDYQLFSDAGARYVCLGGIRSTGLTASMALAEEALAMLTAIGLGATPLEAPTQVRGTPLGEVDPRPYQLGDSRIVCHCERVTESEITDALRGPLPAHDVDSLRRRTRTLAGRCQGFYCYAEVLALCNWRADS
jgi:glycerol-3-phosphate dehydrogenase